jgi:hypothetical protein
MEWKRIIAIIIVLSMLFCFTVSAADASTTLPDWQAYGFSSNDIFQDGLKQGMNPYDYETYSLNKTNIKHDKKYHPYVWEKYNYNSQSDLENAIIYNNFNRNGKKTNEWIMSGLVASNCIDPEVGIPVTIAAILMGVTFNDRNEIPRFLQGYYDYMANIKSWGHDAYIKFKDCCIANYEVNGMLMYGLTQECRITLREYISKIKSGEIANTGMVLQKHYQYSVPAGSTLTSGYVDTAGIDIGKGCNIEIRYSLTEPAKAKIECNNIFTYDDGKYKDSFLNIINVGATYIYVRFNESENIIYESVKYSLWEEHGYEYHGAVTKPIDIPQHAKIQLSYYSSDSSADSTDVNMDVYGQQGDMLGNYSGVQSGAPAQNKDYVDADSNPDFVCNPDISTSIDDLVGVTPDTVADTPIPIANVDAAVGDPAIPGETPTWEDPTTSANIDFSPLEVAVSDKFPFCIPWDLINAIKMIQAPAEEPVFTIVIPKALILSKQDKVIQIRPMSQFGDFSIVLAVSRWFQCISFTVFLALKTRDLIRG